MEETQISTLFVALTGEIDYEDVVAGLDALAGTEVTAGRARLLIGERTGDGAFGGASFSGRIHTGSPILPALAVDVVVTPWSSTRTEIGIRPLGRPGELRTSRFLRAAWPLVESLVGEVERRALPDAAKLTSSLKAAA